jgi:hypothetical protein
MISLAKHDGNARWQGDFAVCQLSHQGGLTRHEQARWWRGMDDFVVDDLRFAQTARLMVEIALLDGENIQTGVHEVNEEGGFVSTYAPQAMGDFTTTRKVPLDLIKWVVVTKESWPSS